jgi:RNA polymerase sigma-70 factor (ECF subfamily)
MDDDATLLRAVRKLDQDALVAVFDRFAPNLYKYALRLCGDSAEADDIVGDVFTQLLKYLKEGKGPRENLRSYLYQIAYHKVVDHARDRKHVTALESGISSSSGDSLPSQYENREQMDTLESIIQNQLTEDQRHVIVLRFIEHFSLKETAEIVGKNVNNVKVIQNRAIARLRQVLDRQI